MSNNKELLAYAQALVEGYDEQRLVELESIRKTLNVGDFERYYRAVNYCEKVLDGMPQSKAYAEAFDLDIAKAKTVSSRFHRSNWVQELILWMKPDDQSLNIGQIKRVIEEGMRIIDDITASNRDKTEAMKALQPYIKAEKLEQELRAQEASISETVAQSIDKKIEDLAERGKMIGENGDIIEAVLID
jgi:hypothetical protein